MVVPGTGTGSFSQIWYCLFFNIVRPPEACEHAAGALKVVLMAKADTDAAELTVGVEVTCTVVTLNVSDPIAEDEDMRL
jgi:hypothetical protein